MEDGDGSYNQRRYEKGKSIIGSVINGMENVKKVIDFAEPFMKSENLDEKFNRLKRRSDVLKAREEDINEELEYSESLSLKRRRNEVETWLSHVAQLRAEVHRAEQEVKERKGRFLLEFKLPEKLDRLTAEVKELCGQGVFPHGLTLDALVSRGVIFPTTELFGKTFEDNKNMILDFLRDDNVMSIGIYGMGGVGKTTMLTHVNNELVQSVVGSSVVWVTVSQKFAIHKLQDDIARELSFSFSGNEDERIRAAELWNFLGRKKNLVLVLDDVWEDIPLQDVGIPVCENGCKLILTTRFLDVCRRMDCQEKVKVMPLGEDESWKLFRDKLGDDLELTPQIEDIAKALVRECAGLPLGIVTMARSMKKVDDLFEWKNELEKMKESKLGYDDMDSKVFQVLKKSYDMLKDPIVQQCFLDCALYPEDFKIERTDLINLFIDEGLIDGMKSREAVFDRGHTILNKLVNACLLEACDSEYLSVKMHDLVRDMALRIADESSPFLVDAHKGLMSVADEDVWKEDLTKVSLMENWIPVFHLNCERPVFHLNCKPPNCPNISTFFINNILLHHIDSNFFLRMKGLVLLNLSKTSIEILPNSISELVKLSALVLRWCHMLKSIPSLSNLRALKKLDLEGSRAIPVPDGIQNLVKLRYLHCSFDGVESFNTCIRLLQERGWPAYYKLLVGSTDWYLEDFATDRNVYLGRISVRESDLCLLPECFECLFVEQFPIEAGCLFDVVPFRNVINLRRCVIDGNEGTTHLFNNSTNSANPLRKIEYLRLYWMKDLLALTIPSTSYPYVTFSSLKELDLFGCLRIQRVFTNSHLPNIETISIKRCDLLVEIIGVEDIPTIFTLPKLLKLDLVDLPSLQSIQVTSDSIQKVRIVNCPKLKRIPLLDREQVPASLIEVEMDRDLESLEWNNPDAKNLIQPLFHKLEETETEEATEEEMESEEEPEDETETEEATEEEMESEEEPEDETETEEKD